MTQLIGERLDETNTLTASFHAAPEANDSTPPPAVPRDMKAEEALYAMLAQKLGYASHRKVEIQGRPPRAVIKSYGIARARSNGETYSAAAVSAVTGTLAIAEGSGSQLGVRAIVEGFERSMSMEHTAEVDIGRAAGKVEKAMRRTIPKIIQDTQAKLGPDAAPTKVTGLGVQIVDNKLVYSGGQPLLVYNIDTGTCTQLTHHKPNERGVYPLGPGRHVVALCSGAKLATDMPSTKVLAETMTTALKEELEAQPDEPELFLAKPVAKRLQQALGGSKEGVMVAASMVEVADYTDTRSPWSKNTDWVHPVTFASTGLAVMMGRYREKRQEVYERWSQGGKLSRFGASALRAADAGTVLMASYFVARNLPGLDHLGHEVAHWTGIPKLEATILEHSTHTGTPQTVADVQALTHAATTHDIAAAPQTTDPTADFDSTYTALAHDPRNDGKATTIWDIARQSLDHYGHQAGLSDAQVSQLQHNPTVMHHVVQAFENDPTTDNGRYITHHPHDWVLANHQYGLSSMNTEARSEALIYAHQLGVEAPLPPAPPDATAPLASAPTLQPTTVSPPSTAIERASAMTEELTADVAETLLVAGVGSGLIVGTADAATAALAYTRGGRFEAAHRAPAEASKVTAQDNTPEPEEALPESTPTVEPPVSSTATTPEPSDNTATDPSLEPILIESDLDPEEIPTPPFKPSVVDKTPVDVLAAHRSHRKPPKDEQDERWEKFMRDSERAEQDETRMRDKSGRYKGARRKKGSDKAVAAETNLVETSAKHKKEKTGILNRLGRLLPRKHAETPTAQPLKLLVTPNDQSPSEQAGKPKLAKAA